MNLDIFNTHDPSGKLTKESYLLKNHIEEYDYIQNYSIINNLIDIPFKEKVYLCLNQLKSIPICKNSNCNNKVIFRNSNLGYRDYCSNKCISSDPNIKKLKEEKSLEKWGTKTPAESNLISDKIKKTNQKKYGGNSPMSSSLIKEKSKSTLIKNWSVDNPSKSNDILKKRIESFKNNINSYKENYEKTSLEKYGVKHPWMNKDIHKKTIDRFYDSYRNRINNLIDDKFKFIDFEKNISTNLIFLCKDCNTTFKILTYQFYWRINNNHSICTNCNPITDSSSLSENDLYDFIKDNYKGEIIRNDRKTISPYEIDIYLPDLKIGFEFNGVFWHSDKFKDSSYHLSKYNCSIKNNIKLYTIWEDDWNIKKEICKSFILNKINMSNSIMARKTNIVEINYNESRYFLDESHLQGDCKSSVRLGLFYNGELVTLMTFSKLRLPFGGKNQEGFWELNRFCNKKGIVVVGGASKLLKYFIKNWKPNQIETYSDNLISNGDLYEKLGFEYQHTSKPGYWYLINGIRNHRFNWRKQKLVKMGYDKNKTEEEIMSELGHWRIYNAGNKKWVLKSK